MMTQTDLYRDSPNQRGSCNLAFSRILYSIGALLASISILIEDTISELFKVIWKTQLVTARYLCGLILYVVLEGHRPTHLPGG